MWHTSEKPLPLCVFSLLLLLKWQCFILDTYSGYIIIFSPPFYPWSFISLSPFFLFPNKSSNFRNVFKRGFGFWGCCFFCLFVVVVLFLFFGGFWVGKLAHNILDWCWRDYVSYIMVSILRHEVVVCRSHSNKVVSWGPVSPTPSKKFSSTLRPGPALIPFSSLLNRIRWSAECLTRVSFKNGIDNIIFQKHKNLLVTNFKGRALTKRWIATNNEEDV